MKIGCPVWWTYIYQGLGELKDFQYSKIIEVLACFITLNSITFGVWIGSWPLGVFKPPKLKKSSLSLLSKTQHITHSKLLGYNVKYEAPLVLTAFLTCLCDLRLDLRLDLILFLGDLRFDLTKILWLWFDLRFDLTKFVGWWLDLRFDLMKVWTTRFDLWLDLTIFRHCDLIWGLTWKIFDYLIWLEAWFDF